MGFVLLLGYVLVKGVIHVIKDSQITAVFKDNIIRSGAGKVRKEIRLILEDIALCMSKLMTHGKGLIHDIHDVIVVSLH